MNFDNILNTNLGEIISLEFITSMVVFLLIIGLSFFIYFKQRKYNPIKDKPSKSIALAEMFIESIDNKLDDTMGPSYRRKPKWGSFIGLLTAYIMLSFVISITGIPNFIYLGENTRLNSSSLFAPLSNPFTTLVFPLSIGLVTFALIQGVSIRYKKWSYLKQFVSPIPFVGLLTIWAPLLSLSLRLFGNAFAGFCLSTIVYQGLYGIGNGYGLFFVPVLMPFFHAFFDLFSGYIQMLVFTTLSMIDIAQEGPSIEEQVSLLSIKSGMEIPN